MGVGTMIGAGIFVLPSIAAANAGPASMISFVIGGFVSLLAALSLSELATGMPRAGGSYYYVNCALGTFFGSIVGWGMWSGLMFATAFYMLGFGQYMTFFLGDIPVEFAALVMAALLVFINFRGVKEAGVFQNLIVIGLLGVIIVFVSVGVFGVDLEALKPFNPHGWGAVASVAATLYVSFIGFEVIATSAEEIKDPGKNLPLAMIASVPAGWAWSRRNDPRMDGWNHDVIAPRLEKGEKMLRYRLLGKTGLRVSEICLGTMSFGQDWGFGADEETSRKVLETYADAGGNFYDTANKYHNGETEEILGRWLAGRRHEQVVATKYTLAMNHRDPNSAGNHRKNLVRSVEKSLQRLQTEYIDLLWVHAWDELTPFEETMRALEDVVRSGKVLYVGVSDTPAWVVSASNVFAELRGWSAYAGLQIEYSLIERTVERDLLPMAEHFDMSILAWAPLGGGVLTGKYTRGGDEIDSKRREGNESRGRTDERNLAIAREVDAVADELGVSSAQVATAWVSSRSYGVIPIVGARKVTQIEDTLGAASVELSDEHLARLDEVSAVSLGFPHEFLGAGGMMNVLRSEQHERIDEP